MISTMFQKILSDVAVAKKSAGAILDHFPGSFDGPEMDAFLRDNLEHEELDAMNPIKDAIDKIKSLVSGLFDKVEKDLESAKAAALLLLDHLPGQSSVGELDGGQSRPWEE